MGKYQGVGLYHLRRSELPREAFLGEMVVGQKNAKVIKPLSHKRIMRTFMKIVDTVKKRVCKKLCIKCCKYVFFFSENRSFLANCENIR